MKMPIVSGLALAFSVAQADAPHYHFRVIDFPGATNTVLYAVNNRGAFVGTEKDQASTVHAIFDDGRQLHLLDAEGPIGTSPQSWAYSINNRDDIAGAYSDATGAQHGYVHHADGTITHIDFPNATTTQAFGINDLGAVIGIYNDSDGNTHAFILRAGQYTNIDLPGGVPNGGTTPLSINDFGEIVGELIRTEGTIGFGYRQTPDGRFTLTTAPGAAPEQTLFISINNRQQILGAYGDPNRAQHNFLKTGNEFRPFDLPARFGASAVSAQTVNDRDEIVGFYLDASQVNHGFIAIPAQPATGEARKRGF